MLSWPALAACREQVGQNVWPPPMFGRAPFLSVRRFRRWLKMSPSRVVHAVWRGTGGERRGAKSGRFEGVASVTGWMG
jgi:hypothetical protein